MLNIFSPWLSSKWIGSPVLKTTFVCDFLNSAISDGTRSKIHLPISSSILFLNHLACVLFTARTIPAESISIIASVGAFRRARILASLSRSFSSACLRSVMSRKISNFDMLPSGFFKGVPMRSYVRWFLNEYHSQRTFFLARTSRFLHHGHVSSRSWRYL